MNIRILLISLFICFNSLSQVFTEDFESGTGSISNTSGSYCTNGSDYFDINNGTGFGVALTGNASNFFGAQDIDACGGNGGTESISWTGIDISSCTGLSLSVDLAEDDDGSNEDWDASDFVHFDVSIDGGAYFPVLWIENDGNTFNSPPYLDTDFDGTGNVSAANEITDTWQNFTAAIAGTGTNLDLRITIALNSGDEDIAIDNITITGSGCGSAPPEDCTNGIDDDGDGLVDCADPDCSGAPGCPESNCSDGIDNDGDGLVDCLDPDCDADIACNPTSCIDGTLGVSGAGCGCISGCDLTSLGGPDCGSGTSGNCSAGHLPMYELIFVPDGCTYTVDAIMEVRPGGCSASGNDSGDGIKVDVQGGGKPFLTGTGNSTQADSYTLTGPGYIEVAGEANRADEIITWTITPSGPTCPNCQSTLPIRLNQFIAKRKDKVVNLSWATSSEINADYFEVERSIDGEHFEHVSYVNASGTSNTYHQYTLVDGNPINDQVSYYRLRQVDQDGVYTYSDIRSVKPLEDVKVVGYYNMLGQEVKPQAPGVVIIRYSDGSTERRYNP